MNSSTDVVSVHLLSQTRRLTSKSELYYVVETPDSMFDLEGCNYFSSWHVGVFNKTPMHSVELYIRFHPLQQYTVKDSDLNFFWAPNLSAGGLNFGLDSQYGNWNISSLNSPLRGILYSMVWRCNLRVVKVNIAFSCRSFMVRRLMFRFGLKFITANLLFMFNRMIVCVCQEHKP